MSQPDMGRRAEILKAALKVFSREGYDKATIKKIAAEAKLKSPALLYWYFKNKAELFQETIFEVAPFADVSRISLLKDQPPENVLPIIGQTMFMAFERKELRRLLRIVVTESTRRPGIFNNFAERGILVVMGAVSEYLRNQVELGRLRPHNPVISARIFLASIITYIMWKEVFPALGVGLPEPEEFLESLVSIVLDGLRI
jgi:AcrR family transcriptional regulator